VDALIFFILVPMVYIAVAVFVLGIVWHIVDILRHPPNPSRLTIYPQQSPGWFWALWDTFTFSTVRRHKPLLWIFLIVFHIALIFLFLGHLELIADIKLLQVISHNVFMGKGFVGLALIICAIYFLGRRFKSPVRELSVPEDYLLLLLLLLTFVFGSQLDWARNWYEYSELEVWEYRDYLSSMVTFSPQLPDGVLYTGHSFLVVVHIFFANLFLMVFPFTHLMHAFLSLPMNKLRRG
jgi:nitrate reductase gamma subunit